MSANLQALVETELDEDIVKRLNQAHRGSGGVRKKILIVFTGGTLGMEVDETGALAPVRGALSKQMKTMKELEHPEMPSYDLIEYDPLLDSADMDPKDWLKIADDIEANYFSYDGFLIVTGTDTMAYISSALSFMLENLAKPVIITGSQIPFCEVYNDARRNLIVSMIFACREDFLEVGLRKRTRRRIRSRLFWWRGGGSFFIVHRLVGSPSFRVSLDDRIASCL
jgi:L-asparaginase/Glu-tRNA(Gln) amidotransferase subunit D